MIEWLQIEGYKYTSDGTRIVGTVQGKALGPSLLLYSKDGKTLAELRINDGRTISPDQRRKVYATLRDMSLYTGHEPEELKELMKCDYMAATGYPHFSLSDCSITTAREFINHLVNFCLLWDIPFMESGLNRTDDIDAYLFMCLHHRKCCICGKPADRHHETAIGMGRDRKVAGDDLPQIALCRTHHVEAHTIGIHSFREKYKVYGVVYREPVQAAGSQVQDLQTANEQIGGGNALRAR